MVKIPPVRTFQGVAPDKAQALKPLEEAAEVFGAWQRWSKEVTRWGNPRSFDSYPFRHELLSECADVIQATLNLVAAFGVEDFRPWMDECERRNEERGRYGDLRAGESGQKQDANRDTVPKESSAVQIAPEFDRDALGEVDG